MYIALDEAIVLMGLDASRYWYNSIECACLCQRITNKIATTTNIDEETRSIVSPSAVVMMMTMSLSTAVLHFRPYIVQKTRKETKEELMSNKLIRRKRKNSMGMGLFLFLFHPFSVCFFLFLRLLFTLSFSSVDRRAQGQTTKYLYIYSQIGLYEFSIVLFFRLDSETIEKLMFLAFFL